MIAEYSKALVRLADEYRLSLLRFLARGWVRAVCLTLYYLAIIFGLIVLYGRGDFSTPPFIYQGF
jgi:hypothetical protein